MNEILKVFHGKKHFRFDKQEGRCTVKLIQEYILEGILCKSLYQIYKPIEICNFVLWYYEDNNSANVFYDLAYPNKIAIKRIRSLKVKQLHFSFVENRQNMEILRRPLENMQDIQLNNLYSVCISITN